jgi:hypothetical protein
MGNKTRFWRLRFAVAVEIAVDVMRWMDGCGFGDGPTTPLLGCAVARTRSGRRGRGALKILARRCNGAASKGSPRRRRGGRENRRGRNVDFVGIAVYCTVFYRAAKSMLLKWHGSRTRWLDMAGKAPNKNYPPIPQQGLQVWCVEERGSRVQRDSTR